MPTKKNIASTTESERLKERIRDLEERIHERELAATAAFEQNEDLRKCLKEWQRAYRSLCAMKCRFVPRTDWPLPGDFVCSVAIDGETLCCVCGGPVNTREDGGEGSQLSDERWTCSLDCWRAAVAAKPIPPCPLTSYTGMTADERDNIG